METFDIFFEYLYQYEYAWNKFHDEATIIIFQDSKMSIVWLHNKIQLFLHFTRTSRQNIAAIVWFSARRGYFPTSDRDTIFLQSSCQVRRKLCDSLFRVLHFFH